MTEKLTNYNTKLSFDSRFVKSNPNFYSKITSTSIPKSKRFNSPKSSMTPGPGSYNTLSKSSTAVSFPKSRRITLEKFEETPGPGNYEILCKESGPKFTMHARISSKSPNLPGPGHYRTPVTERINSIKFSRSERKISFNKNNQNTPGPGQYSSKSTLFGQLLSFAKAKKNKIVTQSPIGPGYYQIERKEKLKFAINKERRISPFDGEKY